MLGGGTDVSVHRGPPGARFTPGGKLPGACRWLLDELVCMCDPTPPIAEPTTPTEEPTGPMEDPMGPTLEPTGLPEGLTAPTGGV